MTAIELIALASSVSLLAGWRLYLVTFATGLAMKFGWIALPEQLQALDVLASNWVIGIAGAGALAEFFADKIAWVDSAWDAVHGVVRPLGGALLSLAIDRCRRSGVAGRQLPARRRRRPHRPRRQGRRPDDRQRQPGAGVQRRRLHRRGCRDRRAVRARDRQSDRRRGDRRRPGARSRCGWCGRRGELLKRLFPPVARTR